MTRTIPQKIQNQLYALSWWRCQNPECNEKIIDLNSSISNIWELAHIVWHSSDWPRWNPDNEHDNSFENLIVLCPNCHSKIDKSPWDYPIELLNKWKEISLQKYKWLLTPNLIWNQVSSTTKMKIQPSLLLNWREKQVEVFLDELKKWWQKIEIKSDSMIESYLFIFASLISISFEDNNIIPIIINNQNELNQIIGWEEWKIFTIIPVKWFIPSNIWILIEQWHNIVLYRWKELLYNIHFDVNIDLWVMDRLSRISALKDMIWDEGIAENIYRDTKGYLFPILRDSRLKLNDNLIPEWYESIDKNVLMTIFLITEWKEDTDKELVKYLSKKEYDEFVEILHELEKKDDSPIRKIADVWQLISKNDLRPFIEENINESILTRFKFVSEIALSDLDPRIELPPSERWMANIITDKRPEFSLRSKKWLGDSLVLLWTLNNHKITSVVESIVNTVLSSEKDVSKLLNSLWPNIQNIAESSPNIFLGYIDANIDNLWWIFEQWDILMWWDGAFTQLLWSLEKLSWSPEYVTRVVQILFKLAEKYDANIRDNYANRPIWTLSEIFLPWLNNTFLDIDKRLELLNSIPNKDVLFLLLIKLFNQSSSSWLAKPIYQNWNTEMLDVIRKDYFQYMQWIINILLEIFQSDIDGKICEVLDLSTKFSIESFNKLLDILLSYDFSQIHNNFVINKLQEIIERRLHHNQVYWHDSLLTNHNDAKEKLISLYNRIILNNDFNYNISLFETYNKIIISQLDKYSKEERGWKRDEKILYDKRIEVLKKIYKENWFEWILDIVDKLNEKRFIVKTIIDSWLKTKLFEEIFQLLGSDNINFNSFAKTFINILDLQNDKLISLKLSSLKSFKNNMMKINFLVWLRLDTRVLLILKWESEDNQKIFWENFWKNNSYRYFQDDDYSEINYYISELNKYWLTYIAFNEIWMFEHDNKLNYLDNDLIIETLEKLVHFINKKIGHIHSLEYELERILDYLYSELDKWRISEDKIFNIEIIYVKVIENPKIINRFIEKLPELFVDLVCNVYKAHNWVKEEVSDQQKSIALNSYEILRKINTIPWDNNWKIDYNILKNWIQKVLAQLKDKDRYEVWSQKLWELLIHCSIWTDWIWPCEEVRKIIEEESNNDIIIWFSIWKRNARWVTSRGIYDWWEQERALANNFYDDAKKMETQYPKTAKILRDIWDSYIWDAKRLDEDVELDR